MAGPRRPEWRQREVPRGTVAALCALLLLVPAAIALGHSLYQLNGAWVHHHTLDYTTCNAIDQDTGLATQADQARQSWANLTDLALTSMSQCHPADPTQDAHIQLIDGYYGDTGWRASSVSSSNPADNASFHARHTHVQFNLTEIGTSYPAYDKRALACREIGKVIGIAATPTSQLGAEGQNNDCMSFWGNPDGQVSAAENPTNYTYTNLPGPHSTELVNDTYAAQRPAVSLSGTLATAAAQGQVLTAPSYGLTVTANQGQPAPEPTIKSIEIKVDGQRVFYGEQSCSGSPCTMIRSWTFQNGAWATGAHTVTVIATDQLGLESAPKTLPVTVATPDTTIDSGPSGPTNNAGPTFAFSSPQGFSQFSCHLDAAAFQACSSPKSYSGLSQGQHTFYARASDSAGHDDPTPASRTFTVDTQAPSVSVDSGPSGATNEPRPTFGFSSSDGSAAFTCSIDTGTASFSPCSGAGTHQPASNLADGSYTFRIKASDAAGNSSTATRSFSVDTQAPSVSIDSGPSGPTNDPRPNFGFSSSEGSAAFTCSLDTGTPNYGPCSGSGTHQPASNLADGPYTFRIEASDAAGNSSTATRSFSVDTQAPSVSIDSGPSGPTNDPRPNFAFSSSDGSATFSCSIDTGTEAFGPCSGANGHQPGSDLADGSYSFRVRATDAAGNWATATRSFQRDSVAPTLSASGELVDSADPLVGTGPEVGVDAADADSGVTSVTLLVDDQQADQLIEDCPDGGCGLQGSLLPDLSEQTPGQHAYEVIATDGAGNATYQPGTFRLDPTPPEVGVSGDLADSTGGPLASETASADIVGTDDAAGDSGIANIEVSVDDGPAVQSSHLDCDPSCPSDAEASYTYSKSDWGQGPHLVTFSATDAAGNVQTTELDVDQPDGEPVAECPDTTPTQQDPMDTVDHSAAVEAAIDPAVAPSTTTMDPDTGDTLSPSLIPSDDPESDSMQSAGTLSQDEISVGPAPSVNVGDAVCLTATQTTPAESHDTTAGGDASVNPNSAADTDTIIRPTVGGETLIQSVRGPDAPESYSWDLGIPEGDQLHQLDDGGIAIVDPEQDPDPDLTATEAPTGANDPAQIPDAETQLAEQQYEIAHAEQETGSYVAAVISSPFTVDSEGNSAPTTLSIEDSDTISVDSAEDATAVALAIEAHNRAPDPAPAYYVSGKVENIKQFVRGFACAFAHRRLPGRRVLLLDFGSAHEFAHAFGTKPGANEFHNGDILAAMKAGAHDYQEFGCYTSGSVIISYGNSNRLVSAGTNMEETGKAQANTARALRTYENNQEFPGNNFDKTHAGVSGDLEPTYDHPFPTKKLARGASTFGYSHYLDFGTANIHDSPAPSFGWTNEDLCDVSFGPARRPLPEIYDREKAYRWDDLRHFCNNHHPDWHYHFAGVTTSVGDGCQVGFGQGDAWRLLSRLTQYHVGGELSDFKNGSC